MLVVMYHYVRDFDPDVPNFKNLTVKDFRRQLSFLDTKYKFLTKESFLESVEKKSSISDGVILTFDDGFKDHYTNVLPILDDLNLWGLFYVASDHYSDKRCLNVHKIHHLLGKYNSTELLNKGLQLVDSSMLNEDTIQDFDEEIYKDQKLSSSEYGFKRLFNYYLKDFYKTQLLNELCKDYFDEHELHSNLYLTKEELVEIEDQGSIIGSHTATHPVLSTLSYENQHREVRDSFSFLDSFLNMDVKSFCYPYGGKSSYNKNTLDVLKDLQVHHSFLVGNSLVTKIESPYELTRVDCNRF